LWRSRVPWRAPRSHQRTHSTISQHLERDLLTGPSAWPPPPWYFPARPARSTVAQVWPIELRPFNAIPAKLSGAIRAPSKSFQNVGLDRGEKAARRDLRSSMEMGAANTASAPLEILNSIKIRDDNARVKAAPGGRPRFIQTFCLPSGFSSGAAALSDLTACGENSRPCDTPRRGAGGCSLRRFLRRCPWPPGALLYVAADEAPNDLRRGRVLLSTNAFEERLLARVDEYRQSCSTVFERHERP